MASPLYYATIVDKQKATVKVELSIVHPDISEFGTDRLFAWKLLHEYVAGADDGTDVELASKYVKAVKLSPLKNATVENKAADYFSVKRSGRKKPTVVYTIEVTDESLLADLSKGASDEVYDFVEPGKGKALTPPPKGKPNKVAATPAPAPAAASYDDLRAAALDLLSKTSSWSDYVIEKGLLSRWARQATEERIVGWLEKLDPGYRAYGAAILATEREDLAPRLLKLAESYNKTADDHDGHYALQGLVPAWWRSGKTKQADAGFKKLVGQMKDTDGNQRAHTLFTMAARGRKWDVARDLVKDCLNESDYRDDLLVPGLVATFVAGETKIFDAVMKKWTALDPSSKADDLSRLLLVHLLDRDEPEKYFDLLFKWPRVIDNYACAQYALSQVEAKNPKRAVTIADKLLADDDDPHYLHAYALAIHARHAKPKAEAWRKRNKSKLADAATIDLAAAAGHDVRKLLKDATESDCLAAGRLSADRDLAIAALVSANEKNRYDPNPYTLVALADLGEQDRVNAILEKARATIEKKSTKERDLPARYFARAAIQVGRADLAFAAVKLPGPSLRRYTAGDLLDGAVACGDFASALAALAQIPDDGSNGRVSSAIQGLLRADEARMSSPRAVPLRAMDATYVRGLIRAKARATLETVIAIARDLPDDVMVEVDAYLEGRSFAPRA